MYALQGRILVFGDVASVHRLLNFYTPAPSEDAAFLLLGLLFCLVRPTSTSITKLFDTSTERTSSCMPF